MSASPISNTASPRGMKVRVSPGMPLLCGWMVLFTRDAFRSGYRLYHTHHPVMGSITSSSVLGCMVASD